MVAQSFTTGSTSLGYTLTHIQLEVTEPSLPTTVTVYVKIKENNSSNRPGDVVAELSSPVNSMGNLDFTGATDLFTAPDDTTLTANTTYWVVVNEDGALDDDGLKRLTVNRVTGNGETGRPGWSIGNSRLFKQAAGSDWSTGDGNLKFTVLGVSTNSPATGAPAITGPPQVGSELTVGQGTMADTDGLPDDFPDDYTFQWKRENSDGTNSTYISGATSSTYTLVDADAGKKVKVRVSFTDDAGHREEITSPAFPSGTDTVKINTPATGAPAISGSGRVGQTLTASTTGISDANGLTSPTYSYQWIQVDGTTETDVGTDAATYMPVAADVGKRIKVEVSFTDDDGFAEARTSAAVAIRAATPPATCPAFTVPTGREQVWTGTVTIAASPNEIGGVPVDYGYVPAVYGSLSDTDFDLESNRYVVDQVAVNGVTPVGMLTLNLDRALAANAHARVSLHVCGETYAFADAEHDPDNDAYHWRNAGLDWSGLVGSTRQLYLTSAPNTPATGAPTVSGTLRAGSTVTASTSAISDANGLTRATFSYQWIRVDGVTETEIAGATGATYTLGAADVRKRIKVEVSFTDDDGYDETRTSVAVPVIGTIGLAPPELEYAQVTGTMLVLAYDQALDELSTPAASAFTVTVAGATRALATTSPVTVSGKQVTLTLSSAVTTGQMVTVTYTVPATNPIRGTDGVEAAALTTRAVISRPRVTIAPDRPKATGGMGPTSTTR